MSVTKQKQKAMQSCSLLVILTQFSLCLRQGIKIDVPAPTQLKVSGYDKELVGLIAAKIRSFRKPEPYKGKGIEIL